MPELSKTAQNYICPCDRLTRIQQERNRKYMHGDCLRYAKRPNGYIQSSNKPVPIFLVIGPEFTEVSESVAVKYASENIGRNIVLITASELKELALEWGSDTNKKKDEPFPLGMLARPGRFRRSALGDLF